VTAHVLTAAAGDTALAAAVEDNFADLLAWYASFPGGRVDRAPDRWLCQTGVPFRAVNAVVRTDLPPATADTRIAATIAELRIAGDPWRWLVGPTARPSDLIARLLAAGLALASDSPGMALDITGPLTVPAARVPGLEIRLVASVADLDRWAELQRRALGLDDAATAAWRTVHARPGLGEDVALRTSIAIHGGRAVASAAVFIAAGVAGVYNVCTLPEMRGLGIGRAITASVLEDGRRQGMRIAVLGASPMGDPVYRGMGFREVCRLRSYFDPELAASQSGKRVRRSARQAS